jgi:hypothetical protein
MYQDIGPRGHILYHQVPAKLRAEPPSYGIPSLGNTGYPVLVVFPWQFNAMAYQRAAGIDIPIGTRRVIAPDQFKCHNIGFHSIRIKNGLSKISNG